MIIWLSTCNNYLRKQRSNTLDTSLDVGFGANLAALVLSLFCVFFCSRNCLIPRKPCVTEQDNEVVVDDIGLDNQSD